MKSKDGYLMTWPQNIVIGSGLKPFLFQLLIYNEWILKAKGSIKIFC